MQILGKNYPCIKLRIDNSEDFWYLSEIVAENDHISGKTERRIKVGQEPNIKTVKKIVFLKILVEKKEFEPGKFAKFLGRIKEGPDDIGKDTYHSFTVQSGDIINVCKDEWDSLSKHKLTQSTKSVNNTLLLLFDRENAIFVKVRKNSYEILSKVNGDVSKKGVESSHSNFYELLHSYLKEYDASQSFEKFILASPSFWGEYLKSQLNKDILKKSVFISVSDVNEASISQALQSKELKNTLNDFRVSFEKQRIDFVLEKISKDLGTYGLEECIRCSSLGGVSELLVSDNFLSKKKKENNFKKIDNLMKQVDKMNGEVTIITTQEEMKKLDSLGGVCGVLRWKA